VEFTCKICGYSKNDTSYMVKGRGVDGTFEYVECVNCYCLQIASIPENMSDYYSDDYYSLQPSVDEGASVFRKLLAREYDKAHSYYYTKKGSWVSRLICMLFPESMPPIEPIDDIFEKKILDVGCGQGRLLKTLAKAGFKNLYGVDPFVREDSVYDMADGKTIRIYKCEIFELEETFDIITLIYSLEHMPAQEEVLSHMFSSLNKGGGGIVKIPTVSSYAYRKYGMNWFSLGAPEHLFLHSVESISILCRKIGFIIDKIVYDSPGITLSISKYLSKGYSVEQAKRRIYSPAGVVPYLCATLTAKYLNNRNQGDTIAVYLRKP